MRLAVTADLHWKHSAPGDRATRALAQKVAELAPEVLILAGDVGTGEHFGDCLALFSGLGAARIVLPGNHDIWTNRPAPASLALYEEELPQIAAAHGFHYLDAAPWLSPDGREAIAGSMNWYDYSYAPSELLEEFPEAPAMFERKLFPRGRHNDGQFVRLGMTDAEFTGQVVERFRAQLESLPASVERIVVVQHHPPVPELFYPSNRDSVEGRFWLAYTGNRRMEEAVMADPRVATIICGHTHAARAEWRDGRRCLNVGGDYGWKRLLLLDTETGEEAEWVSGRGGDEL